AAPATEIFVPQIQEAFAPDGPRYVMLDVRDWVGSLGNYLRNKTVEGAKSALSSHILKQNDPELFAIGVTIENFVLSLISQAMPALQIYGNTFYFRLKGDAELSSLGWHRHRTRPLFATLEFASQMSTRVKDEQAERGWLFIADGNTQHRSPTATPGPRVTWVDFFSPLSERREE
ncbi:MAG: hypothetical protein KDD51_11645, partial [Bdellovibrionales bacterium]|nr:hypothetical protein [Bdellovibrionales bacterium]